MTLLPSLLVPALLIGQAPAPTIRTTTRLVQVNVVVRSKGAPVNDLTAGDFELRDRGKPQKIAFFSMNSATAAAPRPAEHLPANVFTNRQDPAGPSNLNGATVLLIDGLNTDLAHQSFARDQVRRFLGGLDPGERVAIYALGRQLNVIHDFSQDREHLAKVVAHFQTQNVSELFGVEHDLGVIEMLDKVEAMSNADVNERVFQETIRVDRTIATLDTVAKRVATLPGSKSLIWISGSFPVHPGFKVVTGLYETSRQRSFTAELARTARLFNEANMAIYPVDVRGLFSVYRYGADGSRGGSKPPPLDRSSLSPYHPDNRDSMKMLADGTGGVAYFDNNDLSKTLKQAFEDARATYTLGFYPDQESADGKYHELQVSVARKGVDVRYRKGYYATAEPGPDPEDRKAMVRDAFWSPLEATGIEIRTRVEASGEALNLVVEINPETLTLEQKDGHWTGGMDIYVSQCDVQGREMETSRNSADLNLSAERYAMRKEKWLALKTAATAKPDAVLLRIIVQDRFSGSLGSVLIPITRLTN
jgi:VWFA-related protein